MITRYRAVVLAAGLAVALAAGDASAEDAGTGPKAGCIFDDAYLAQLIKAAPREARFDPSRRRYIQSLVDAVSATWREERALLVRMSPLPPRRPGS